MAHKTLSNPAKLVLFSIINISIMHAGIITGTVTGDISHIPWRTGPNLGWASVRIWQDGKLIHVTRTETDGTYATDEMPAGTYQIEILRPGSLNHSETVNVPGSGSVQSNVHLDADHDFELIAEPRAGHSIFRIPGGTFDVYCRADANAANWAAELVTEYLSYPLTVIDQQYASDMINYYSDVRPDPYPGWKLTLEVPAAIPEEVFHLKVSYRDEADNLHTNLQPRVVSIKNSYPERFRLLMHLDWHFNTIYDRPGVEGEQQADYFRAASLLNTLWISLGDDIGFETEDAIAMYWHMIRHYLHSPIFMSFGQHDADITEEGFHYYFGSHVYSRNVGTSISIVRSFTPYQLIDWVMSASQINKTVADLDQAAQSPQNQLLFMSSRRKVFQGDYHFDLPSSLSAYTDFGETVSTAKQIISSRLFLRSFSIQSMHGWFGLPYYARVMTVDLSDSSAGLSPQVILPSAVYSPSNNGNSSTVTATIKAQGATEPTPEYLNVASMFTQPPASPDDMVPHDDLSGLTLRFVMPPGFYSTNRGVITQQINTGPATLVYVVVDMENSEMNVTVQQDTTIQQIKKPRNGFENLKVYPGIFLPQRGEYIKVTGFANKTRLHIYTLSGNKVHSSDITNGGGEIIWNGRNPDGHCASPDIYMYVINDETGNETAGKLLIGN
jgi:hypothetical protein